MRFVRYDKTITFLFSVSLYNFVNFILDIKELQKRWQNITDNIMYLGSYVNSASGLKISWNTAEPFIDSKMKSLPAKALDIINKAEEAQNRSEQALKVANDKLTKMLQLKQKRLSKDIDNGQGPAFIAELISAGSLFSLNIKRMELSSIAMINHNTSHHKLIRKDENNKCLWKQFMY